MWSQTDTMHKQSYKRFLCSLWFLILTWARLVKQQHSKRTLIARVDAGAGGWRMTPEQKFAWVNLHVFTKQTCSCDLWGSPAARRRPSPSPGARKSGSRWAACPTGWPRHPDHRTRSPSTSSVLASLGEVVQTGRHPARSLSPGSRWLQTFWRRRWAVRFAAEREGREGTRMATQGGQR